MSRKRLRIRARVPWAAYPGSTIQQNYAEDLVHGYLLWDIRGPRQFEVRFEPLPNPRPYITVPWRGDVQRTLAAASAAGPRGSRVRVHAPEQLPQRDVLEVTKALKEAAGTSEVTFKIDRQHHDIVVDTGRQFASKADLHNPDVIMRLVKDYHARAEVGDEAWAGIQPLIAGYVQQCASDDLVRNSTWRIKQLEFDNTFSYGEGNSINFDNLAGIVGVFGPNRSGKSSIAGTLVYALFNGTDRGSIKNLHVINARKSYCLARAVVNVAGADYVIERQTVKHEGRRRQVGASTSLNVFRMEGDQVVDLDGEQRNDTERVIRRLIGCQDDFMLTSLSAQDDVGLFISHGSTKRRQILSRFLDLDVFDRMHELAKNDLNAAKVAARACADRDWDALEAKAIDEIDSATSRLAECERELHDMRDRLHTLRSKLTTLGGSSSVTPGMVKRQQEVVEALDADVQVKAAAADAARSALAETLDRALRAADALSGHDVPALRCQLDSVRTLRASIVSLRHVYERESAALKHQERSLKILGEVPCGDAYPTCKFIKDAHESRSAIEPARERVESAALSLASAQRSLENLGSEELEALVDKLERLQRLESSLQVEASNRRVELVRLEPALIAAQAQASAARRRLDELLLSVDTGVDAEVLATRSEIDSLSAAIARVDSERLSCAATRGRAQSAIEKYAGERAARESVLMTMRGFELVASAFSRRGIPNLITRRQLPIINAEIAEILSGIVDFTVELETDDDSDATEVYINYGDSRRIIELGSGMEKMIASVAIRVALSNVSSLPKTDMLIIDEGFGALDEAGVEACNRLLGSLKKYFRVIIVITHVEGIKDAADTVIEVTRNEKDARVVYA